MAALQTGLPFPRGRSRSLPDDRASARTRPNLNAPVQRRQWSIRVEPWPSPRPFCPGPRQRYQEEVDIASVLTRPLPTFKPPVGLRRPRGYWFRWIDAFTTATPSAAALLGPEGDNFREGGHRIEVTDKTIDRARRRDPTAAGGGKL